MWGMIQSRIETKSWRKRELDCGEGLWPERFCMSDIDGAEA
jgi:hypothetical protein